MDLDLVAYCPVCQGRLAGWIVRQDLTCHHCHWALRSNFGSAFAKALSVAAVAEALLLWALKLAGGAWEPALEVWLLLAGGLGLAVGVLTLRRALRLTPIRPPRASSAR